MDALRTTQDMKSLHMRCLSIFVWQQDTVAAADSRRAVTLNAPISLVLRERVTEQ